MFENFLSQQIFPVNQATFQCYYMLFNISLHKITFRAKRNPQKRSLPCFVLTYLDLIYSVQIK